MAPDRVLARIDQRMVAQPNGCITSTYSRQSVGYCQVGWHEDGVRVMALIHRLVWERANGPIPDGHDVDHICRNRACVNVDHLRLLTAHDNRTQNGHWAKTHCIHGHPYDAANTYIRPSSGHRTCRECARQWKRLKAAA